MASINDFVKESLDTVLDYTPSNDKEEMIQAVVALNMYFPHRTLELSNLKVADITLVEAVSNQDR